MPLSVSGTSGVPSSSEPSSNSEFFNLMLKEFDNLMQKTYFHLSPMLIYLLLNTFLAMMGHRCGMWNIVPSPGIESGPWHWEHGILAAGLLGKSLHPMFKTLFQAIVCYPAFLATIIEKLVLSSVELKKVMSFLWK